jgi:lysozyme family protein
MASDLAFERAYRFTMPEEAGRVAARQLLEQGKAGNRLAMVDDPADRGGCTAYGITQRTFTKWLTLGQHQADRDVWTITAPEIRACAREGYWLPAAQFCPDRLAIAVFDTCFLHGKGYGIPRLQLVLGVKADGQVGALTKAALDACAQDPVREAEILQEYLQSRDDRYEQLVAHDRTQGKFYHGWEDRLDRLEDLLGVPHTTDSGQAA